MKIKISVGNYDPAYQTYIRQLSALRKLSSTIHDAMMLYKSLQDGRKDVLLRLFPFLEAALVSPVVVSVLPPVENVGSAKPLSIPAPRNLQSPSEKDIDDLLEVKKASDDGAGGVNMLASLCLATGSKVQNQDVMARAAAIQAGG